jgi:hypothetical protein
MFDMKCGCGREARYQVLDSNGKETYACNKHVRCLDYEDLRLLANLQRMDIIRLKSAAEDILAYREGTEKYQMAKYYIDNFTPSQIDENKA